MGNALHKLRSRRLAMDRTTTTTTTATTAASSSSGSGSSVSWEDDISDEFMAAVLSFCSHMGGRLDALDNARLYDEFRSFTALTPGGLPAHGLKVA